MPRSTDEIAVKRGSKSRSGFSLAKERRRWLERIGKETKMLTYLLLFPLLAFLAPKAQSLWIKSIEVPPAVVNSSQVILVCNYDLQSDQLYSVKWYKNYVEFYRFQPSEPQTTSTGGSIMQSQADNQMHSKHDFELDGINLILSKSNATHVYLKQTNLASEGTYKCEVSADSPSFATVSLERQMKVYVLPRQKLSIVDNSVTAITNSLLLSGGREQQVVASEQQAIKPTQLIYNLNDIINVTCISGPSRPVAKLSWLINDTPVPESSKWLTHHHHHHQTNQPSTTNNKLNNIHQQQEQYQLSESKLTLSFRLQPSHLLAASARNDTSNYEPHSQQQLRFQALKLRCIAKLSVDFATETSVVVSGGKTTVRRRQQQQHQKATPLPLPSSLQSTQRDDSQSVAQAPSQRAQPITSSGGGGATTEYPMYRWPRPLSAQQRTPSNRRTMPTDTFVDAWITSPVTQTTQSQPPPTTTISYDLDMADSELPTRSISRPIVQNGITSSQSRGQHHVIVWASRQLRAQAEHIDQMLRLSHPNEMDTPIIEAKTQILEEPGDVVVDSMANGDDPEDSGSDAADSSSTGTGEVGHSSGGVSPDTRAVDSPTESWDESEINTQSPAYTLPTTTESSQASLSLNNKDSYELNDLVQFTCSPRVSPPERDVTKSVHLRWFINNKEVTGGQVNAYDGSKFHYVRDQYDSRLSMRPPGSNQRRIFEPTNHHGPYLNQFNSTVVPSFTTTSWQQQPAQQQQLNEQKPLLVEFTQSLFQLKELNLKCRTVVEQPLIEYESQLVVSVPSNQFIQVDTGSQQYNKHRQTTSPSSSVTNGKQNNQRLNGRFQSNNNNGNQQQTIRNRNGIMRPTQSSSSSSSTTSSKLLLCDHSLFAMIICYYYLITTHYLFRVAR